MAAKTNRISRRNANGEKIKSISDRIQRIRAVIIFDWVDRLGFKLTVRIIRPRVNCIYLVCDWDTRFVLSRIARVETNAACLTRIMEFDPSRIATRKKLNGFNTWQTPLRK